MPSNWKGDAVVVTDAGTSVEVRRADGQGFRAFIIVNERDPGDWLVFRGPNVDTMHEPLSAGFRSKEEAVSAARTWVMTGRRRMPRGEAGGVRKDPTSKWRLREVQPYYPIAPGFIAAVDDSETGQWHGLVLTDQEMERFRGALSRGEEPSITFPLRRLISHEEATDLRLRAILARHGG